MKKLVKLFGIMLALMLAFTTSVKAAPFDYTAINGTTTKLKKYLVIDQNADIPDVTFTFKVTPGTAVAAADGKLPVYAGTGTIADATVSFSPSDTGTEANRTAAGVTDQTKVAAVKDITLTFTPAQYDKPGVYRYIVTEQASDVPGVKIDTQPVRTIDVYVEDNNGTLQVAGYVAYEGTFTAAPAQNYNPSGAATDGYANGNPQGSGDSTKSNKYVNEVVTNELTLEKEVTGNQGDKESQWEMKVNFETLPTGVSVQYAKIQENGRSIASPTYADYTNNSAITLGHGDKYDFKGIPEGVKYTVTETKANQDGYTTTYTNETYTYPDDDTPERKDAKVVNNRTGVLPTGVAMAAGTGIVIVGVGLAGLFLTRKRREDEE